MEWTMETPTEAGWYWYRSSVGEFGEAITILQVYDVGEGALLTGHMELKPVEEFKGQWVGPLIPPIFEKE